MENQEKMEAEVVTCGYQSHKKLHRKVTKHLELLDKTYGCISEQFCSQEVKELPPEYNSYDWRGVHELSRASFFHGKDAEADKVYQSLISKYQKAKERAEEEKKRQEKEKEHQQELQTAFDSMPEELKEAIHKTVDRLDNNGDFTKYTYYEIAIVLASFLGFCEIEWSEGYNSYPTVRPPVEVIPTPVPVDGNRVIRDTFPIIARALHDLPEGQEEENRVFTFLQNNKVICRIKLPPHLDCDKFFYEYTIFDFIATEVETTH